jgi:hypothetical protein
VAETKEHTRKLPKLKVESDGSNDFATWFVKSKALLEAWGYWKVIEGPELVPPVIPPRVEPEAIKGEDVEGNHQVIVRPGNIAEHEAALRCAEPWQALNLKVRALIFQIGVSCCISNTALPRDWPSSPSETSSNQQTRNVLQI